MRANTHTNKPDATPPPWKECRSACRDAEGNFFIIQIGGVRGHCRANNETAKAMLDFVQVDACRLSARQTTLSYANLPTLTDFFMEDIGKSRATRADEKELFQEKVIEKWRTLKALRDSLRRESDASGQSGEGRICWRAVFASGVKLVLFFTGFRKSRCFVFFLLRILRTKCCKSYPVNTVTLQRARALQVNFG